jgi:DUF4097 and DUF4098 domain-containing protein YvlB
MSTPDRSMPSRAPRRRSIFSGLLLTGLGVFFLAANLRRDWALWEQFFYWWPLILILWGVARLFDVAAARRVGQAPPRTLSGGEFFLVLFLILLAIGTGAVGKLRNNPDLPWGELPWGERYEFTQEVSRTGVPAGSTIALDVRRGDITVHQTDGDQLLISVRKYVDAPSKEYAERWASESDLELAESAGRYELRPATGSSDHPRVTVGFRRSVRTDLDVALPRGASLRVGAVSGNLNVSGLAGSLSVENQSGSAEIRDVGGAIEIEKRRGELRVENARGSVRVTGRGGLIEIANVTGDLHIEGSYSGPVRVRNAAGAVRYVSERTNLSTANVTGRLELDRGRLELVDAAGDLTLNTRSYDMLLENLTGSILVENRNTGNIDLRLARGPRQPITVRNEKGHVELAVPGNAAFSLSASARNGRIYTEFTGINPVEDGQRSELTGQVGRGGPAVRLETSIGDIRIRPGS